jgi:outer membrane protein assembly factor BamB
MALLAPGPHHSTGGQYDRALTPAVPVSDGLASELFLASTDTATTTVHRVTRPDTSLKFAVADSAKLSGGAAPAMGTTGGLLYVTTSKNLYVLDAATLALRAQFSPGDLPAGTGFGHTTPAVAAGLVFVVRDNGEHLVLDARTLQPVAFFTQHQANTGAAAAFGRPALSGDQVLFATDRGLFAYGLEY